jgi:pimeloyl-ACP methyl ester carboxylesterase
MAGQEALDQLVAACGADPECARAFPDFRAELAAVLTRLETAPVEVAVENPATGQRQTATLTRELFATRTHLLLFSSRLSSRLPWLVHRGAAGDFAPFAQLAAAFGRAIVEQIDFGMQLSVLCTEDAPLVAQASIEAATAGTFLGPSRARQILHACAEWPHGVVPAGFREPVRVAIPTLIISGAADPVTPPRFGAQVARDLPRALHVIVPHGSHVDGGDCVDAIARQFLRAGSPDGLDLSCLAALRRPPFFTGTEAGASQ